MSELAICRQPRGDAYSSSRMFATSSGRSTWQSWPVFSSATSQPEARAFAANGAKNGLAGYPSATQATKVAGMLAFRLAGRRKLLLKATQTKITQPGAHEVTCLAGLESPEVQVARPRPATASRLHGHARRRENRCRSQAEASSNTLCAIFRNERIQKNQSPHLLRVCLSRAADDHPCVAMAYKDHRVRGL